MDIGITLKKIRVDKGLTREEVSEGIITKGHYLKIEKNLNKISLDNFIKILKKLNVSFDEFFFIANDYKNDGKKEITNLMIKLFYSNDKNELNKLKKRCAILFEQTQDIYYEHHFILIKKTLNDYKLSENDEEKLKNYLFNIENYSLYEIKLFTNFIYMFQTDTLLILANRIVECFLKFKHFQETSKDYVFFLLNIINVLHSRFETKIAYEYIQLTEEYLLNSLDFFSLTVLKYHKGLNKIQCKDATGKIQATSALNIFKELNPHYYELYLEEYENYLKLYD